MLVRSLYDVFETYPEQERRESYPVVPDVVDEFRQAATFGLPSGTRSRSLAEWSNGESPWVIIDFFHEINHKIQCTKPISRVLGAGGE